MEKEELPDDNDIQFIPWNETALKLIMIISFATLFIPLMAFIVILTTVTIIKSFLHTYP